MNCANHPQNAVAAYCRTCGKPLCTSCTRPVMGVVYCENCLAERVAGTAPASAMPPYVAPIAPMPVGSSGPNPGLAGILAGFFPFGVGAVYCGQYAKGLAHLVVFVLLIVGQVHATSDIAHITLGFGIAGFYFYQIIDAVRTAKAMNAGQPAPDPLGLGTMFSPGERRDVTRGAPAGAVILIALGVLFLLQNTEVWFLSFNMLWPIVLIAIGGWLFTKRQAAAARGDYRHRSMAGPAVLVTIGVLFLLENLHDRFDEVPGFGRTFPVILLVIGIIKLMERRHVAQDQYPPATMSSPLPPEQQSPPQVNDEVKNG
jgi:hypothetical protein